MPSSDFVELFRSDDFLVKHAHRNASICVVTFDSYADDRSLERDAFAQEFLQARGLSAVHIVNGANRWYQEPDLELVLAELRPVLRAYKRVVLYGSSMGGYAVLRFADRLGADLVIAISPQYTLAPRHKPIDLRWNKAIRRFRWRRDLLVPLTPGPTVVIIYDPMLMLDRRHVDQVEADRPVVRVPIPYSGHPAGTYLAESGLIVPLIMGLIRGNADIRSIVNAARRARRQTPAYWMALMMKMQKRSVSHAIDVGVTALRLHPNVPYLLTHFAILNLQAHNFEAALEALNKALQQAPESPIIPYLRARTLAAAGRIREARLVPRKKRPNLWNLYMEWIKATTRPSSRRLD